jgi:hypothetical protein
MWWLEMPNPALWGVVAGLTNFVPYLGGLVCLLVIGVVALVQFDSVGRALPGFRRLLRAQHARGQPDHAADRGRQLSLNPS